MNQQRRVVSALAAGALALVLSGVAAAEPPKVLEAPPGDMLAKVYPDRAVRLEVKGTATLACTATDAGLLKDRKVTHEWPPNFDFGAAALSLAPYFKVSGPGEFKTRVNFQLGEDDGEPPMLYVAGESGGRVALIFQPTAAQLAAAYPGNGSEVIAVGLECRLAADGRLQGCADPTAKTAPEALATALRMAALYRTEPPPAGLVGGATTIAIVFIPPDPGEPSAGKK